MLRFYRTSICTKKCEVVVCSRKMVLGIMHVHSKSFLDMSCTRTTQVEVCHRKMVFVFDDYCMIDGEKSLVC